MEKYFKGKCYLKKINDEQFLLFSFEFYVLITVSVTPEN